GRVEAHAPQAEFFETREPLGPEAHHDHSREWYPSDVEATEPCELVGREQLAERRLAHPVGTLRMNRQLGERRESRRLCQRCDEARPRARQGQYPEACEGATLHNGVPHLLDPQL